MPVAALVNDPVDAIQLEAIAAELIVLPGGRHSRPEARRAARRGAQRRAGGNRLRARPAGGVAAAGAAGARPRAARRGRRRERAGARRGDLYARHDRASAAGRGRGRRSRSRRSIITIRRSAPPPREVIGRLDVTRAGDALIVAVNDSTSMVRFAAMRALGDIRESRAVQALTEQLTFYNRARERGRRARCAGADRPASSVAALQGAAGRQGSAAPAGGRGRARPRRRHEPRRRRCRSAPATIRRPRSGRRWRSRCQKLGQHYVGRLVEFMTSPKTALQVAGLSAGARPVDRPGADAGLQDPIAGDPRRRRRRHRRRSAVRPSRRSRSLEPLTKDRDRAVAAAATRGARAASSSVATPLVRRCAPYAAARLLRASHSRCRARPHRQGPGPRHARRPRLRGDRRSRGLHRRSRIPPAMRRPARPRATRRSTALRGSPTSTSITASTIW